MYFANETNFSEKKASRVLFKAGKRFKCIKLKTDVSM